MPINLDLEAIRKRVDAATPGPWHWGPEHPEFSDVLGEADFVVSGETPLMQFEPIRNGAADAEFVAYARQDIPAMLAEIDRLRAELETMLGHYSRALDEIYRLRTALAYEASVVEAHLDLATFPKSRRGIAVGQIERMRESTRGETDRAYADCFPWSLQQSRDDAGMGKLTRHQWETDSAPNAGGEDRCGSTCALGLPSCAKR